MPMSSQGNIGDQIRDAVQDAINKQDYTALRQTVQQGIDAATEAIGRSIQNAQQQAQQNAQQQAAAHGQRQQRDMAKRQRNAAIYQQRQQAALARHRQQQALAAVSWRYAKGGSTKAAGIGMTIGGGFLSVSFGLSLLGIGAVSPLMAASAGVGAVIASGVAVAAFLGGSIALLVGGTKRIGFADRFQAYRRVLGTRQACPVAELQQAVGKSADFVVRDLRKMIAKGMFTQGHLNADATQLIVTNEAYQFCLEAERTQAEQARVQRLTQDSSASGEVQLSAEEQALLAKGNAYVARIRAINQQIPDPEITRKINQIETVVQKIFEYAGEHPEVIGDLQRLMDYYLPTTVKLLDAYADLDAQPIQGENITSAKREIEETLDTLSVAFERLLDSIFKDMTWDVSTDISVLHTVLAQEGLVEGAFEGKDSK